MNFYDIFHLMRLTSRFAPFCLVSCHLKLSNKPNCWWGNGEGDIQRNNKYIETSYAFITQRKIVVFFSSRLFNKIVSNRQRITPPISFFFLFFIMIIIIIILDVSFAFRILVCTYYASSFHSTIHFYVQLWMLAPQRSTYNSFQLLVLFSSSLFLYLFAPLRFQWIIPNLATQCYMVTITTGTNNQQQWIGQPLKWYSIGHNMNDRSIKIH